MVVVTGFMEVTELYISMHRSTEERDLEYLTHLCTRGIWGTEVTGPQRGTGKVHCGHSQSVTTAANLD